MPVRVETRHSPNAVREMHPKSAPLYTATVAAAVAALRRVGSEAMEWSLRSGTRIDAARMTETQTSAAPRTFGRAHDVGEGRAEIAVEVLIDGSGSMQSEIPNATRRPGNEPPPTFASHARAIGAGIADGARACGIPATIGHHGRSGGGIRIAAHTDTARVVRGRDYSTNDDAYAVAHWWRSVARIGARGMLVLVCDGAPNTAEEEHREQCARALRMIERDGYGFVMCYIGRDHDGLARARREWGAHRVADLRHDVGAIGAVIVRALRDVQQRANS